MRLINKDNKIYLYDELKDKYKLIEPDDLEHILDNDNKLYPDETIRVYFKFKEGKYKTNKKGYTSKKANIKQEYKAALDQTQKDYIVSNFLNDISGLRDIDRMAFIKSPTIQTIKKFSVDEETKKKLINRFNDISKNYITIKDDGDDINDMFNYFISNNINISLSQAAREVIKSILKDFRDGKLTVEQVKDKLTLNKSKFYDPQKPENYEKFIKRIETLLNISQTDLKDDKKKNEIDEELKKVNEIVDEAIPDNKVLVLDKSEFENEEAFNQAKILNENNMFVPSEIFKSSKIKKFNDSYFGTNAVAYRILKYLSNKDFEYKNVEHKEEGDYYLTKITFEYGDITIPIDKNQYLYEPLKNIMKNLKVDKEDNEEYGPLKIDISDDIFKTEGNTIKNLTEKSKSKNKKNISKNLKYDVFEYNLDDEDTKNILNKLEDDITRNEFVSFIDYYYDNYNDEYDNNYIHPDKTLKASRYPYIGNFYTEDLTKMKKLKDESDAAETKRYYERLFKVLPKYLIEKIPPYDLKDIIKVYTDQNKTLSKSFKENNEKIKTYDNKINELQNELISKKDIKKMKEEEQKKAKEQNEIIDKRITELKELKKALKDKNEETLEKIKGNIDENGILTFKHDFITDKIKDKYNLTDEEVKKYNNILKKYVDEEVLTNKYYMTSPSDLYRPDNKPISKYNTTEQLYNYAKLKKYENKRIDELEDYFDGLGGSWSFNVLNKIDELNNILKMSSGSWSFNVLNKIDELNGLLKNNSSAGSWSYNVLNKINELNDLI